jgi:hypothetical protein
VTSDVSQLKTDVCNLIEHGGSEATFNDLALRLFRWHLAEIPRYRSYCQGKVDDLAAIDDYRKIPPLPVEAFKYAELCAAPADRIVHRFSTSGTSQRRGPARRGTSAFDRDALEIMSRAIQANAATYLFPDGVRCRIFVLAPRPSEAPHMIMAHGMRHLMSVFGDGESDFFAGKDGLEIERLLAAIEKACQERVPVCLIGASFGFVHLLDAMSALGKPSIRLVPGSRLMDAGGYKGKSRELTPDTFRELVARAFDLPDAAIVNLLGMTELSSQIYDSTLASGLHEQKDARRKLTPPWFRTRVANVDDISSDAAPGEVGLLVHYDLANFSRPLALLSDDLGRSVQDGFQILSRVKSSEPRGCSVSVDELWRQV